MARGHRQVFQILVFLYNVRALKIVHLQVKPFTCKLNECGKQFTQLNNLKVRSFDSPLLFPEAHLNS